MIFFTWWEIFPIPFSTFWPVHLLFSSWRLRDVFFVRPFVRSTSCHRYVKLTVHKKLPIPGIEPGPSGWKPDILATRPYGRNEYQVLLCDNNHKTTSSLFRLEVLRKFCYLKVGSRLNFNSYFISKGRLGKSAQRVKTDHFQFDMRMTFFLKLTKYVTQTCHFMPFRSILGDIYIIFLYQMS